MLHPYALYKIVVYYRVNNDPKVHIHAVIVMSLSQLPKPRSLWNHKKITEYMD